MTNKYLINWLLTNHLRQYSCWTVLKTGLWKRSLIVLLAVSALLALLSACSNEQQLPPGAVLTITPSERTLNVADRTDENGFCVIDPELYIDWAVVLELTDDNGSPIGERSVRVYVDYGANTFSGYPVMALYDDRRGNGNGLVDEFELVSGAEDNIANVNTDKFGGDRELLVRINYTCPFRGDIFAFVQGVTASSTIEVVARKEGNTDE